MAFDMEILIERGRISRSDGQWDYDEAMLQVFYLDRLEHCEEPAGFIGPSWDSGVQDK
jgi:hypothetical protein